MSIYCFIDLDDTLFQTRRKCPPGAPVVVAAHGRDGAPLSFMTHKQRAVYEWMSKGATVIPTTARNFDAFRRVALPFTGAAILDFGGVILGDNGELDTEWDAIVRGKAADVKSSLHDYQATLTAIAADNGLQVRARVIGDFDMDLYVVAKQADIESGDLARLHELCRSGVDQERFGIHFNDNNLSITPRFLNKRFAVEYMLEKIRGKDGDAIVLGMGDSLSDLAFMGICDYSVLPTVSQAFKVFTEAGHV